MKVAGDATLAYCIGDVNYCMFAVNSVLWMPKHCSGVIVANGHVESL